MRASDEARHVRSLHVPVFVLSHTPSWRGMPEALGDELEAIPQRLQASFLTHSQDGVFLTSGYGGHNMPGEDPDLVIRDVLTAIKKSR